MKLLSLFFSGLVVLAFAQVEPMPKNFEHANVNYWLKTADGKDNYFHQTNIDLKNYEKGMIRAKVDGKWQDFTVRELPDSFVDWSIKRRLETMERVRKNQMPELAGAHNGMVASHGLGRLDSKFTINNAVKGMGFIPKPEKLEEVIKLLTSTRNDSLERKTAILESLYNKGKEIYDRTKQVSLELYSNPEFETHSFLNQMTDPGVSIVFLDFPSYEIRCITQLLHPKDPKLTKYEQNVIEYINSIHDYFHGMSPHKSIAVIYHVIEVFNNTPGRARGRRVVPTMP
ncbi:MAG: hypothetical protein OEZ20_06585 [candidate division WOR-3 bacterium]|nr:hypothetical protein [candidate division WOR-3 bacterium]MDH5684111.1 hypothetical protein [candidate division WOR-3 bacterium]